MKKPPTHTARTTLRRKADVPSNTQPLMAKLYRRAEAELRKMRKMRKQPPAKPVVPPTADDSRRLLHELQVHQVELELQNAELEKARDDLERAVEKYTDLYDFAPVGYFTIDESGVIQEANLTGAVLLGVERSRLINRRLLLFVSSESRQVFLRFLQHAFSRTDDCVCETQMLKRGDDTFWASFRATPAISLPGARRWCRVTFSDITSRKQAEEANRRANALDVRNRALQQEVSRRQEIEKALRQSQRHKSQMLAQAHDMHLQLRQLSRQVLRAQEEERRKISRELHDVIAQTLAGISVRLAALKQDASPGPRLLARHIAQTQRQVEQSVKIVQRFARELRPAVLDHLGLIPALHAFMKKFTTETGIRVQLAAFAEVDKLDTTRRTTLFRVAQEALTNVAQHAQASRVRVDLQCLPDQISMTIADNGTSFDVQKAPGARGRKRLGLIGMRERLEMVGGQLDIRSTPGKGTTIEARIPLRKGRGGGGNNNGVH